MGLFSFDQMERINKAAEESTLLAQQVKPSSKASSVMDELNSISQEVISYFKDSPAKLISTKEQLHDYVTRLIEFGIGGIDTETTGLDRIKDTIVGTSLYYPGEPEVYIPSRHIVPIFDIPYKNQLSYEEVGEELQRIADSGTKLIFANADFDLAMIYKDLHVDFNKSCFFDVILAWRCLKENEQKNGLKELYNKYVLKGKGEPKKFSDFFPPELFPYCKPEVAGLYAANDAKITYELYLFEVRYLDKNSKYCQKQHLEKISDLVWNIEFPLMSVCQNMHRVGVYVDKDVSMSVQERYHQMDIDERIKLSEMVDELLEEQKVRVLSSKQKQPFKNGKDFNPGSPLHTKYLVYTLLNVPPDKDGKMSTDKSVLAELNIPIVNQILKVRSIGVLINTFVDKMPNSTTSDSRIHARFNSIGARCIVGDSLIPTETGYFRIDDLCKDCTKDDTDIQVDNLTIVNKDQLPESVESVIKYTSYSTIKITTEYGFTIEGTPNHPIMISNYHMSDKVNIGNSHLADFWKDRMFRPLGEIKVGDLVEIPCSYSNLIKSEYQPSNLALVPYRHPWLKSVAKIPEIVDEEFALFLGMYHADGHSGKYGRTYQIRIYNDDPDVIEQTKSLYQSLFNLTGRFYADPRRNGGTIYASSVEISSLDSFLSHGEKDKKIPDVIYKSPVSVINNYIKGMTLDSSITVWQGRVRFVLTIRDATDAKFIQMHLASQGILCSTKSSEVMSNGGREYRVYLNSDNYVLFRDLIGFVESKKYICDVAPCQHKKYESRRIGNSFRVKVEKIEQSVNDVYDLHVPGTHSFISNGIISHNTGRFSSADPNLQNIPSRATDIRHMFRATPPMEKYVNCTNQDDEISVELGRYDKVYTPMGTKTVKDLVIGDEVVLMKDDKEVILVVRKLEDKSTNPSICNVVLGL